MHYTPAHSDEIIKILQKHPEGIGFQDLYKQTTLFVDTTELSSTIHRTTQLGLMYKKDKLFFLTVNPLAEPAQKSDPVTEVIRELIHKDPAVKKHIEQAKVEPVKEPKVVATQEKLTEVKPLVAEPTNCFAEKQEKEPNKPAPINGKPLGNFQKGSGIGQIAYAFYRFRLHGSLSINDALELIQKRDITKSTKDQSMFILRREGFIELVDKKERLYKWSDKYAYPFSSMKPEDTQLLRFTPEEYKEHITKAKAPAVESVPVKEEKKADVLDFKPNVFVAQDNYKGAMDLIDWKINQLKNEIETLEKMRDLLAA